MLFGIQMCARSSPLLFMSRLTAMHQGVQAGREADGDAGWVLALNRGFPARGNPAQLLLQRYREDLCKVSGNAVPCFSIAGLADGQFAIHFSHRYGWKHPAKSLCAGTVLLDKQTVPRQVCWGRKPTSTRQTQVYISVLSVPLLRAGLLIPSGLGLLRRSEILGRALCHIPKTAKTFNPFYLSEIKFRYTIKKNAPHGISCSPYRWISFLLYFTGGMLKF